MDLILRNATIITDGIEFSADLAVRGETVAAIGNLEGVAAAIEIDATGKFILPGCVDIALNLHDDGSFDPESGAGFAFASQMAALGGVTTVVATMEVGPDEDFAEVLKAQSDADAQKAAVDFGYHLLLHAWTDKLAARLREASAAGVPSAYVARTECSADFPAPALLQAVLESAPEDFLVVASPFDAALAQGLHRMNGIADWPALWPPAAEAAHTAQASMLAAASRARLLLAGISCAPAIEALRMARETGRVAGACTLPHLFYDADPSAPRLWPPARPKAEHNALFAALEEGILSAVVGGHKPRTSPEATSARGHKGIPPVGLGTLNHFLPLLHSEGAAKWRLSLGAISQCAAADPAKLAGLYPRKGSLQPGSDADFAILDPNRECSAAALADSAAKEFADPLASEPFRGTLDAVFLRGRPIARDGQLEAVAEGRFQARKMALK